MNSLLCHLPSGAPTVLASSIHPALILFKIHKIIGKHVETLAPGVVCVGSHCDNVYSLSTAHPV